MDDGAEDNNKIDILEEDIEDWFTDYVECDKK